MNRPMARIEQLELRRLLTGNPGFPDTDFGTGGEVITQTPGVPGTAVDSLLGTDGSLYYLSQVNGLSSASRRQFSDLPAAIAITKITPGGVVDTSFGQQGRVTFTAAGAAAQASSLRILPDGSLLASGTLVNDSSFSSTDLLVFKVTPAGVLDSSFGISGFQIYDAGLLLGGPASATERVSDMELVGTNRLLVLGQSSGQFNLLKINTDTGALDTTFNSSGIIAASTGLGVVGPTTVLGGLDVDLSGRIYIGIRDPALVGLSRRLADGSLDTAFGDGGEQFFSTQSGVGELKETSLGIFYAYPSAPTGGLAAASTGFTIAKLNPADGSNDPGFGSGSPVEILLSGAESPAIFPRADGRIIVAAADRGASTTSLVLVRAGSAGQDLTYGSGGTVNVPLTGNLAEFTGVVRPDDRFLTIATGNGEDSAQREVRAFDASGFGDTTFNPTGSLPGSLLVREAAGGAAETQSVVVVASGNTVALQSVYDGQGIFLTYLLRLSPSGIVISRDELFPVGTGGGFFAKSMKLMPLPDGSLLVGFGGIQANQVGFARLNGSGILDQSFGTNGYLAVATPGLVGPPLEGVNFTLDSTGTGVFISSQNTSSVFRVDLSGALSGFGAASTVVFSQDTIYAIANSANGGVLAAGFRPRASNSDLIIHARDSAGVTDASFNGGTPLISTLGLGGVQFIDPRTIVRLAGGRIAVGGSVFVAGASGLDGRYFMLLLEADGSPVSTFGNNGVVFAPTSDFRGSAIFDISDDPSGGYIVVGEHRGAALLARFNNSGALDGNFGDNVNASSPSFYDRFVSLAFNAQGMPVVGGWTAKLGEAQRSARVVRFNGSMIPNPPAVSFTPPPNPNGPVPSINFSITVVPFTGRTIDTTSFSNDDVTVTLPGGGTGAVTFVNFTGDPSVSLTANYTLVAPVGGFGDGNYNFALSVNAIRDTLGAKTPSQLLGSSTFTFASNAPTATFVAPPNPTAGATQIEFSVIYTPASGRTINTTTLDSTDILVGLPNDIAGVVVFSRFAASGASAIEAFYTLVAPQGGFVAGTYLFDLAANAVADSFGVQIAGQSFGSQNYTFGSSVLSVAQIITPLPQTTPGGPFPVSVVVSNTGTVASISSTVSLFLVTTDAPLFLVNASVPSISPNGTFTVDFNSLTIPANTVDGNYTLRATIAASSLTSSVFAVLSPPPVIGSFDPSFGGGDGVVITVLPGAAITTTSSVPLAGGRILSVGFNTDGNATLVRTLSDGTTDTTFGPNGDGRLIVDLRGTIDIATSLIIDAQGNALVTGYSIDPSGGGSTAFVFRATPSGQLDTTFANAGIALLAPASLAGQVVTPRFAQLDPMGRLLVVGANRLVGAADTDTRAFVLRVAPDGTADASFGNAGLSQPAVSPGGGAFSFSTALLLPDGKLLLGGAASDAPGTPQRFLITRLDAAGNLDLKFGRKGLLLLPVAGTSNDRVTTIVATPTGLGPKGSFYAGGLRSAAGGGSSQAVIFRITARGAVDRGFARGLAVLASPGATVSTVTGLVIQAEGRVLASLTTASSAAAFQSSLFGVTLVRLDVKGVPDRFFNQGQPLVVVAVPVSPTAAQPVGAAFDDFAQTRQGQANAIEGGAVRSVATRPTTGGTELRVVGIVPDGVDFASTLTAAKLPATVAPGFKSSATLTVSNAGSLGSKGAFSVTLVARPAAGGNEIVLRTLRQTRAVKAGSSFKLSLPIALSKTFAVGEYALLVKVDPTFAELSRSNNNVTRSPNFTVAVPPGRSGFSFNPITLRPSLPSLSPDQGEHLLF